MAKRGRKPDLYKKGYFYDKEEQAVLDYIKADTFEEKNAIFEETLRPALKPMIESIIRRYKLQQKGEEFEETFDDALAFIISKIDRYKKENGKAFSYLQTVCKHHLIGKLNEYKKQMIRNISYDEMFDEINESEEFTYDNVNENNIIEEIMLSTIEEIEKSIDCNKKLSKNEVLVGTAISEILRNWDEIFPMLGSNKFNKSSILLYIKETTNLPTKDIRNAMRKFKLQYFQTKNSIL